MAAKLSAELENVNFYSAALRELNLFVARRNESLRKKILCVGSASGVRAVIEGTRKGRIELYENLRIQFCENRLKSRVKKVCHYSDLLNNKCNESEILNASLQFFSIPHYPEILKFRTGDVSLPISAVTCMRPYKTI